MNVEALILPVDNRLRNATHRLIFGIMSKQNAPPDLFLEAVLK